MARFTGGPVLKALMHKMMLPAILLSFGFTATGCDEKKEQVRQEVEDRVAKGFAHWVDVAQAGQRTTNARQT